MSRRKSKSDRELIADLTDRTKLFCDSYYDPKPGVVMDVH